jgi:hypothetical protein
MPGSIHLRAVGQVAQVTQHATIVISALLTRIIGLIARMGADEAKYPTQNRGWKNSNELTRSHTGRKEWLPAGINRAAQFRRAPELQLLLVLPPKGESHGDYEMMVPRTMRNLDQNEVKPRR